MRTLIELKLALTSAGAWGVLAISQVVDGALEGVVLIGAVIGALGVIGHAARRSARFIRRVSEGVDLLFHMAGRLEEVEERVEVIERHDRRAVTRRPATDPPV